MRRALLPAAALLVALPAVAAAAPQSAAPRLDPNRISGVPSHIGRVAPAIIGIRVEVPPDRPSVATLGAARFGSGVIFDAAGYALTVSYVLLDAGRIGIAALSVGLAQGAFEAARQYARTRRQFGQPIASFQAIQWKLADMATRIEAARLLTYRAAFLKDRHRRTTSESAMAKLYASEVAVRVAEESVQIHGGYGFVKDYPAEKFFRDVKLTTIGEGTSEIQRLVIARQLLS